METRTKSSAVTALNMYNSASMVVFGFYILFISRDWAGLMLLMYVLSIIAFAVICFVLPESPKFLLINNRASEAHESLRTIARINGANYSIPPDAVFIEQDLAGHLPARKPDLTLARINSQIANLTLTH